MCALTHHNVGGFTSTHSVIPFCGKYVSLEEEGSFFFPKRKKDCHHTDHAAVGVIQLVLSISRKGSEAILFALNAPQKSVLEDWVGPQSSFQGAWGLHGRRGITKGCFSAHSAEGCAPPMEGHPFDTIL